MNTLALTRGILHELGVMLATVFTTAGKGLFIDKVTEDDSTATFYIGWGTGAGTSAVGDTTLFTEASEDRVAATMSQPSADTVQWLGTMTADGNKTITNAGVFTAPTSGTLVEKGDFTGRYVETGDQIIFTCQIQLT